MGPLEWFETSLKLIAIAIAVFALCGVINQGFQVSFATRSVQIILLGVASFGLVLAIYDRLQSREVISMTFVLINNIGHWSMFAALIGGISTSWPVIAFCGLMLTGDIVKTGFFLKTGYTVRGSPRIFLLGMIFVFMLIYLTILLMEVI